QQPIGAGARLRGDVLDRRRLVQRLGAAGAEEDGDGELHLARLYAVRAADSALSSMGTTPAIRTPSSAARAAWSSARRKNAASSSFQRASSIRCETVATTATGIGAEVPRTASD